MANVFDKGHQQDMIVPIEASGLVMMLLLIQLKAENHIQESPRMIYLDWHNGIEWSMNFSWRVWSNSLRWLELGSSGSWCVKVCLREESYWTTNLWFGWYDLFAANSWTYLAQMDNGFSWRIQTETVLMTKMESGEVYYPLKNIHGSDDLYFNVMIWDN